MRVFSCKSYCPSICTSKSHSSLNLQVARDVSSSPPPVSRVLDTKLCDEKTEVAKDETDDDQVETVLKSSLKKSLGSSSKEVRKEERVKWMDYAGKELAEIREFEHIESVSSEDNGDQSAICGCVIQ